MRCVAYLGAPDHEMERIEALLQECGVVVRHALLPTGERVRGGDAYRARPEHVGTVVDVVLLVECRLDLVAGAPLAPDQQDVCDSVVDGERHGRFAGSVVRIDHHAFGDPGYARSPAEFLAASSLGQTISWAARVGRLPWRVYARSERGARAGELRCMAGSWAVARNLRGGWSDVSTDLVLAAASDHCPSAAYAGRCPGVDPVALTVWRARGRAQYQGRTVADLVADVERGTAQIVAAPELLLGGVTVRDLRGLHVPELPEASLRLGQVVLFSGLPGRDGRVKFNLLGDATGDAVRAFLSGWGEAQGLSDLYGDPARGYAGGYA